MRQSIDQENTLKLPGIAKGSLEALGLVSGFCLHSSGKLHPLCTKMGTYFSWLTYYRLSKSSGKKEPLSQEFQWKSGWALICWTTLLAQARSHCCGGALGKEGELCSDQWVMHLPQEPGAVWIQPYPHMNMQWGRLASKENHNRNSEGKADSIHHCVLLVYHWLENRQSWVRLHKRPLRTLSIVCL